ncbi:MAG: hypothetical protein K2P17_06700 [Helicobacteraceae bacterium]|nr:hypothetical protein [Helicobacteraceae bacterium]
MSIIMLNLIFAIILLIINPLYLYSFEVAFIGTLCVIYSSYKAILKKVNLMASLGDSKYLLDTINSIDSCNLGDSTNKNTSKAPSNHADSTDFTIKYSTTTNLSTEVSKNLDDTKSSDSLPKMQRFLLGSRISFSLFRILSYGFIALGVVALINNKIFFVIPFLLGVLLSSLISGFYVAKKLKTY